MTPAQVTRPRFLARAWALPPSCHKRVFAASIANVVCRDNAMSATGRNLALSKLLRNPLPARRGPSPASQKAGREAMVRASLRKVLAQFAQIA